MLLLFVHDSAQKLQLSFYLSNSEELNTIPVNFSEQTLALYPS
jgi:hypothetical protein